MRIRTLVSGMLIVGTLAVTVVAQDAADRSGRPDRGRRGGPDGGFGGRRGGPEGGPGGRPSQFVIDRQMERLNKEFSLTPEQQEKIRKLMGEHHEKTRDVMRTAMRQNSTKLQDLRTQIEEARKADDTAKVTALEEQRRKLLGEAETDSLRDKLTAGIAEVLTSEQKPKFDKMKGELFPGRMDIERHPEMLMRAIQSLNLPKEREAKIQAILDEARGKTRGQRARGEGMRMEMPEVGKKMMEQLTPEERAKVKAWVPERPGGMGTRPGDGRGGPREGMREGMRGGPRGATKEGRPEPRTRTRQK